MRVSHLDFDGEPAKLIYNDDGSIHDAVVFHDGAWRPANWADLFFKAKKVDHGYVADFSPDEPRDDKPDKNEDEDGA